MSSIPKRRKKHLIKRIKERVGTHICQNMLEENLDHSKIMFAKKLTNTRSLAYMVIDDTPIKFIYSKECKKIITVLTINHDFIYPKTDYVEYSLGLNVYRVKIFPDAYLETENNRALTVFEILENGEWRRKKKIGDMFNLIFERAWNEYENSKKIQTATT